MFSWIPRGGLGRRADTACDRTGVHCPGSVLSSAVRTHGCCSGAALVSAASRHWSCLPTLLTLELNGPEASGLLVGSSISYIGKCWVGQAHVFAYVTSCLWQVLFCFNFKRWQMQICYDRWQPLLCSNPIHETVRQSMICNMFCKVNDRPRNRVPRIAERRPARQQPPRF